MTQPLTALVLFVANIVYAKIAYNPLGGATKAPLMELLKPTPLFHSQA